jgi:hypothetical protein
MPRRQGDAQTNALIVREGLTGTPIAARGTAQPISQALHSHWRDQALAHAASAFAPQQHPRRAAPLEQGTTTLTPLVGELLLEGKTSAERPGDHGVGRST